jgi:hypothetical protein
VKAVLDGGEWYIDDIIILSERTFEEHLKIIRAFFERLTNAKLTINLASCEFCHSTLTFLGHKVEQGHVKPVDTKEQAINGCPVPTCKRQLMRFLGMACYNLQKYKTFLLLLSH